MVDAFEWCKAKTKEQLRDSWVALGQQEAKNSIPVYTKDNIYKVTEAGSPLEGSLILARETYRVTSDFPKIDWTTYFFSPNDEYGIIDDLNIQSPFFALLMDKDTFDNIAATPVQDIIPYEENNADEDTFDSVLIQDQHYYEILGEAGYPFIKPEELEVGRGDIIRLCILPALRDYYTWFPIVKEEIIGNTIHFIWDLPPFCIGVLDLNQTTNGSTASGGTFGMGAFHLVRTEGAYGGIIGQNRWANVTHRKPVPGFTGRGFMDKGIATLVENRAYLQGVENTMKRVKYTKIVKSNGNIAIEVNSKTPGIVSAWLAYWSNDFRMVEFNRMNEVIRLAGARLRQLLFKAREHAKSDIAGQLNTTWLKEGEQLEKDILKTWKENGSNKRFAIMRSGRN